MLATLIQKELKAIILSPKFAATLAVCSILILIAIYTGVSEYQADRDQWQMATQLAEQQARESTSWNTLSYKTMREPDPMQVFVSGLTNDIGRWSAISSESNIKLRHSSYSDDPVFAVFRHIDFAFIVQVVLSLFAILFTFDAVSGERESGTLRLVFANNVPRAKYLFAKCTGAWLGLVIPITIPILLGLLLVVAMGVPLTTAHWWKLVLFLQLGLLYFTFFITLGVLISALTRRSSVSFLVGLMVWVIFVLIIPRAGVMAAGQMITVPRVAEIEGQRDGFAKDQWAVHYKEMEGFWADAHGNSEIRDDEDEAINDARMWEQMQQQDAKRSAVEQRIQEYESKLLSDLRRRKEVQRRLAFTLARISPVSAFQLGAMQLAGTGVDLKSRYENAMSEFRTDFNDFVKKRKSETNDMGGMMMITIDSEKGMEIGTGRDDVQLDFEGMPVFQAPTLTLREAATPIIADMGILAIGILLSFFGSFLAFVRYDVR